MNLPFWDIAIALAIAAVFLTAAITMIRAARQKSHINNDS
jgi:hypothetical protein